jgi:Phosphotransferase enzyme family
VRVFFTAFQHGDLNARNLLISNPGTTRVKAQMIDFEKACESSPFLDLCWLSLWLLSASKKSLPVDAHQWAAAPAAFANVFAEGSDVDDDVGALQTGVDLARELARGVLAKDKEKSAEAQGFWKNRIAEHLKLTLGATALAMSYYEVRSVVRLVERGGDRDAEEARLASLWAICFFHIAALALRHYSPERFAARPIHDIGEIIAARAR